MNPTWSSAAVILCLIAWAAQTNAQDNATTTDAPKSTSTDTIYLDIVYGGNNTISPGQPTDPKSTCQQLVQQYGNYQITDGSFVQNTCSLTCSGKYEETNPQNLYSGTPISVIKASYSYEITTGVDDLRPCGDQEGQLCIQGNCVKLASDYQDVCKQTSNGKNSLAVEALGGCKVKCITAGQVTSIYGSQLPGLIMEDVILPDYSKCNNGNGKCSGGSCLTATLFSQDQCSC